MNVFGVRVHYDGRIIKAQRQYRIAVLVSRDRFDAFLATRRLSATRSSCRENGRLVFTKQEME